MPDETNYNSGLKNGKCIDCGACGESGCCSPVDCKMLFNSPYCKRYLTELKATYTAYSKLYALVYKNADTCPELFNKAEEINSDRIDEMEA